MKKDSLWGQYSSFDVKAGHLSLKRRAPLKRGKEERVHFVFVESIEEVTNSAALEAPDATTIAGKHHVFVNAPVRFRTSGPEVQTFLAAIGDFDELETGQITELQRRRRREQLVGFFETARIPIIDIYISRFDAEYKAVRQTLLPGSWSVAVFSEGRYSASLRPIIFGAPEFAAEDRVRYAALRHLTSVMPPIELRLRDIFSLNHVRDAVISSHKDEDEGSRVTVPPRPSPGFETHDSDEREQVAHQVQKLRYLTQG
jgi:hypothetical protein